MQRARSEQDKDQRRNSLLFAALDEFYEKGFNAARMQDIAERAHLSKGTLYLYFTNKQALFQALIEEIAVPTISHTSEDVLSKTSATEALQFFMQSAANIVQHSPLPKLVKVIIADGKAFPELLDFYRQQVVDKILTLVSVIISKGVRQKRWHCPAPELAARLVVAPVLFSAIWRVVFESTSSQQSKVDIDALFALHTQHILAALTAVDPVGSPANG